MKRERTLAGVRPACYTTVVMATTPDVSVREALRTFGKAHPEIAAIYLFGSVAEGHAGPLSDLDVGVLLAEPAARSSLMDRRLALIADVSHACRRPDVDVVILNEAPPLLAYEVVGRGTLLFERDRDQRVAFEARAAGQYLDFAPFLATSAGYLKRQLRDGTYGG